MDIEAEIKCSRRRCSECRGGGQLLKRKRCSAFIVELLSPRLRRNKMRRHLFTRLSPNDVKTSKHMFDSFPSFVSGLHSFPSCGVDLGRAEQEGTSEDLVSRDTAIYLLIPWMRLLRGNPCPPYFQPVVLSYD
jgi:hypothetical protein